MTLLSVGLYIIFILAAIVLVVVILLQEGKGGGLTDALGTSGQQTFGVGASGINKFTGWVGAIFLATALGIHVANRIEAQSGVVEQFGQPVIVPGTTEPGTAPKGDAPPAAQNDGGQQTPPPSNPPPEEPKKN